MKMKSKNYLLKNVEDYWEIINYNYDQIQYAEIKSSVVVSVYSLFFTAAYTIDVLDDENVYNFSMSSFVDYIPMLFLILMEVLLYD